jgi:transposase
MTNVILGIDISKLTFDVTLLIDNKVKNRKFDNNKKGFDTLIQWLKTKGVDTGYACMEATGSYGLKLARYLYENNFKVSVVNPVRIKGFAQSKLCRVKTDKADSDLIAHFCQTMKQLVNRLDALISIKNQETNRLEGLSDLVATNIKDHIIFLNKQIKEVEQLIANHIKTHQDLSEKSTLLASIPGVGEKTISQVLTFLSNIDNFNSSKQVIAFLGLNPKQRQSGTSVRGTSRISKTGNAELRKAFYMPAIVSLKYNPVIKGFVKRLSITGKPKMVIVIAAMRKLIHIIYGVLKNKTLFNEKN